MERLEKLLSARFLMSVFFSFTTCVGFMQDKISGELFVGIVMAVVAFYFNRDDRQKKENVQ